MTCYKASISGIMQEATEKRTETYVEARMDERITLGTDLSYSPPIIVGEHDVARESILDEKDRENSETETGGMALSGCAQRTGCRTDVLGLQQQRDPFKYYLRESGKKT